MKNETVIGTIGKTQGVISIAKPHRIASSTRLHKERCPTPELSTAPETFGFSAGAILVWEESCETAVTATEESVAIPLFTDIPLLAELFATVGFFAAGRVILKSLSSFTQLP